MKKKISIEGMSCSHCVNHVTNALSEIDGVKNRSEERRCRERV